MGRVYEGIDERLGVFLEQQPVFFVGTAPVSPAGHVNVSPKGQSGTFASGSLMLSVEVMSFLLTGSLPSIS